MENVKILLENGVEVNVNGLFYIYNSKYYFIYTLGELDENEYIKFYVVQVCKEIKNTVTGPIDTGYMLGLQIQDPEEWKKVQESITKIVDDKKNGTQNPEIQYLPINMLVNLKVISNNKFKLMKQIIEANFKVTLPQSNTNVNIDNNIALQTIAPTQINESANDNDSFNQTTTLTTPENDTGMGDVIIDYRARFFEEQEKNRMLEEEIKVLNEKLYNIKNIIG